MRHRLLFSCLSLVVFTAPLLAQAGSRLEYAVAQPTSQERITVYIQGPQARIISSANNSSAVIFNAEARQIHLLDHANKEVTTIDQASLEQLAEVARNMGEVAQAQGGVLGDIFKTFGLENELGKQASIEVIKLDSPGEISGRSCQMYRVISDGDPATELCLSNQISLGAAEQVTLNNLIGFAQLLLREGQMVLKQFNLPIPLMPADPLAGMPVYIDDMASDTSARLVDLKQVEVAPQQFALPAGYSRRVLSL